MPGSDSVAAVTSILPDLTVLEQHLLKVVIITDLEQKQKLA